MADGTCRYLPAVCVHTASQDVPDRCAHAIAHVAMFKTTPKARLFCQLAGFVVDVDVEHVAVHAPLCHQSMIKPIQYKARHKTRHSMLP